jgi:hypothetical protein
LIDEYGLRDVFGDLIPPGFGSYYFRGPHTQSAGTAEIANQSGGDSMDVDQGAAFERTLMRIRERYALYFYLPDGVQPLESSSVEVNLSNAARQRYPRAEVRYRRSYLAPNSSREPEQARPIRVGLPLPGQVVVI